MGVWEVEWGMEWDNGWYASMSVFFGGGVDLWEAWSVNNCLVQGEQHFDFHTIGISFWALSMFLSS